MPLVSVIVPNYNHSKFLKQRLDTILGQTFQDFELILLDDCSTDNSRDLLEEYRDHPKVTHLLFNETNSGSTFKQWEKGIRLAKGEYIWIAESDDYSENTFLEKLVNVFTQYASVVIAYCQSIEFVDGTDEEYLSFSNDKQLYDRRFKESRLYKSRTDVNEHFIYSNMIPNASGVVFKKSACLDAFIPELAAMKLCGDWLFWLKCMEKGDIFYLNVSLNHFRTHDKNVRSKSYGSIGHVFERLYVIHFAQKTFNVSNKTTLNAYKFQFKHALNISSDVLIKMSSIKKLVAFCLKYKRFMLLRAILTTYVSYYIFRFKVLLSQSMKRQVGV